MTEKIVSGMHDLGLTYEQALHGVQSAIKHDFSKKRRGPDETAKHLRVGIDSSLATHLGLARLLIDKGVFTMEEYTEYIRLATNQELYRYQQILDPTGKMQFR